jgi:hypothetical protein
LRWWDASDPPPKCSLSYCSPHQWHRSSPVLVVRHSGVWVTPQRAQQREECPECALCCAPTLSFCVGALLLPLLASGSCGSSVTSGSSRETRARVSR